MKLLKKIKLIKSLQLPKLAKIGFLSRKIGIRRARGKDLFMRDYNEEENKKK